MIDHAIPPEDVESVHAECVEATEKIQSMRRAAIAARKIGDGGEVTRNELHFLPKYAKHLGGAHMTAVARAALDSHVRIAQLHVRHVPPNQAVDTRKPSNSDIMASGRSKRGWHTDWPHDLSAYGQGENNGGAVRQPFPDICMCLSMVWYLQDTDSESGGTWIVRL